MTHKDPRSQLASAQARLSDLYNKADAVAIECQERCKDLIRSIADGGALEGDLLAAQMQAEQRQSLLRKAALAYEQEVVLPLQQRVRQVEIDDLRAEITRLNTEAAAAHSALDDLLTRTDADQRRLTAAIARTEDHSARLQRKLRQLLQTTGQPI